MAAGVLRLRADFRVRPDFFRLGAFLAGRDFVLPEILRMI
jgi:hypothetical protein